MNDSFDRRVRDAEGRKKIFDNRVKYILFFLAVGTGVLTCLDKCSLLFHKTQVGVFKQQSADSLAAQVRSQRGKETAAVSHKRHLRPSETEPAADVQHKDSQSQQVTAPPVAKMQPVVRVPIQTAYADNTEFELLSAVGNIRAQTIKMTVVLTTSAANWHIWSDVHSIIDPDGNEYLLKSFTNGASSYDNHVALNTGVPIKCTYTFGGVLPSIKPIRLFKFEYRHRSLDDPIAVEFRDIPIAWH